MTHADRLVVFSGPSAALCEVLGLINSFGFSTRYFPRLAGADHPEDQLEVCGLDESSVSALLRRYPAVTAPGSKITKNDRKTLTLGVASATV